MAFATLDSSTFSSLLSKQSPIYNSTNWVLPAAITLPVVVVWIQRRIRSWLRWCTLLEDLPHPTPTHGWFYHLHEILWGPTVPGRGNKLNGWLYLSNTAAQFSEQGLFCFIPWSPWRLPWMCQPLVTLLDDELTQTAMSHPDLQSKGILYETSWAVIQDSVLSTPTTDAAWKRMRRLTAKAFSTSVLVQVTTTTQRLLEDKVFPLFSNDDDDAPVVVDVVDIMARLALDVLGKVAFSYEFGGLDDVATKGGNEKKTKKTLYKVFEELMEDASAFTRSGGLYKYIPLSFRYRPNIQYLNSTINYVVEKRLSNKDASDSSGEAGLDLLHYLLETNPDTGKQILSRAEILGNTKTFLFAGHDTTSSTLTFILYEIGRHPQVMQKLRDELDPLFLADNNSKAPSHNELRNSLYLDAVIRETLRLHPPALYSRASKTKDVVLRTERFHYTIPKGTEVMAAPWLVHRLATGDAFDPDRTTTGPYFPFAIGLRNCVGRELALAEIRAVVAHMVHYYDWSTEEEEIVTYSRMTLNPNRCHVQFHPRTPTTK